jgi:arylformamidase
MFSKDDYSYIANTVTSIGAIAVVIDYALMPRVRMMTLIDQVRAATDWVIENIASRGGAPSALTVSGHSAGAHLACWLFDEPGTASRFRVKAALLLGGIYDLAPLRHSFLQDEIHLTDEEVKHWTPMGRHFDSVVDCAILVGEQETPLSMIRRCVFSAILFSWGQGQALLYSKAQTT